MSDRHIVAMGGWDAEADGQLTDYMLELTGRERPRVCLVPTAIADDDWAIARFYEDFTPRVEPSVLRLFGVPRAGIRDLLLAQDVIFVGGGNTANMLAIWRVHGVDAAMREAWGAGTVLAGWSAGAICWFEGGVTDSFGPELQPIDDCLGFLAGSFCPHYDGEVERRPVYERLVASGAVSPGYAADDGVGLHFAGSELAAVVAARPGKRAFRVEPSSDGVVETPLEPRSLSS